MKDLETAIRDLLATPAADPRVVPLAKEVIDAVKARIEVSEDLRRYRETRGRMGRAKRHSFAPPNFPITVHSS